MFRAAPLKWLIGTTALLLMAFIGLTMWFADATPKSSVHGLQTEPLPIEASDVIAERYGDELVILLNVYPFRDRLGKQLPEAAVESLTATALHQAVAAASDAYEHADFDAIRVVLIELSSMDEYNEADWSSMVKHGTVEIRRVDDLYTVTKNDLYYAGKRGRTKMSLRSNGPQSMDHASNLVVPVADEDVRDISFSIRDQIRRRLALKNVVPKEHQVILDILKEGRDPKVTFEKLRPLCSGWMPDYEGLLNLIESYGYSFRTYDKFDPGALKERVCYISHDVHYRDIPNAACMMDVEHQRGMPSTYYIYWDYCLSSYENLEDWQTLIPLALRRHRFGLHGAYPFEYVRRQAAGTEGLGDLYATQRKVRAAMEDFVNDPGYPNIINVRGSLIPDPDRPSVQVLPEAEAIEHPKLQELTEFARKRIREQLQSMEPHFGPVRTFSAHGSPLARKMSKSVGELGVGAEASTIHNRYFFSKDFLDDVNLLNVRDQLHFDEHAAEFPYLSDNSGNFEALHKGLRDVLESGKAFGLLVHPALWERNYFPQFRRYKQLILRDTPRRMGEPLATIPSTSEEIVFDELDLYDHPARFGRSAPPFSPERVRRINAHYYSRSSAKQTFGEVVLNGRRGSVLYLPRQLLAGDLQGVSFWYRKKSEGNMFLRLYKSRDRYVTAHEEQLIRYPSTKDGGWQLAFIPLNVLEPVRGSAYPDKQEKGQPMHGLRFYEVSKAAVYGLELGIENGKSGDTLQFDRIVAHRSAEERRAIRGRVQPAVADLVVEVRTPDDRTLKAVTDAGGRFQVNVPDDFTRCEVVTRYKNIWYAPSVGRYLELGSYVPPLEIELGDAPPEEFAGRDYYFKYVRDAACASRYRPDSYFLYRGKITHDGRQELFIESSANHHGYLDRDRRMDNPDGAYRIVIMGACYIAGHQIESQEHVTAQLEAMFRFHDCPTTEVISVAHNTLVLLGVWPALENHVFSLKPDLVLLNVVTPTQLGYIQLDLHAVFRRYDPAHPESYHFELDKNSNQLVHIPHDPKFTIFRADAPERTHDGLTQLNDVPWVQDVCRARREEMHPRVHRGLELWEAGMKMFVEEARRRGTQVALLYGSDLGSTESRQWKDKEGQSLDTKRWRKLVKKVAKSSGALFVDGMAYMHEEAVGEDSEPIQHWKVNGHWSPAGHRAIAHAIFDQLRSYVEGTKNGGSEAVSVADLPQDEDSVGR